ncbi:uncharacterized protein BX664DRAFT_356615 [Halteromyces radiatus]|uniref:uncharacterized protein n=1 Tax=Halteromyces radiatus TaxID=101107 RepID=UPI002220468E|nr:uncharacterized protein BX664DRAFT_356615 [Halteromyces radiatus]KAI8097358.1 hypothetical protein BX664DRAFT_356615 [Halteromyces radiatus]
MSYIASLNLLGEETSIPLSEEDVTNELAMWANAEFKFDSTPGSALLDLKPTHTNDSCLYNTVFNDIHPFDQQHLVTNLIDNKQQSSGLLDEAKRKSSVDEDKRRRNTAASARFRMKKKLREQALQQTVKDMTAKADMLEERCKTLEMEAKWLRALLVEKNPALLPSLSTS